MYLGRKTTIEHGIEMPEAFSKLPEKIEPAILESLIPKVRAGDMPAINTVIEGHSRLAIAIAAQYASILPHKDKDLASAALQGATQAVHWIASGRCPHDNVTGYIITTVHRYVTEFIEFDSQIRIPRASLRTNGIDIADFLHNNLDHTKDVGDGVDHTPWVRECLSIAIESPTEQVVINAFERGDDVKDVAEALGCSVPTIYNIRKAVHARFIKVYNE